LWFVTTTKRGAGVLFRDGNLKVGVALAKSNGVPVSILVFPTTNFRFFAHTSVDFVLDTEGGHVERVQLRNSILWFGDPHNLYATAGAPFAMPSFSCATS
jgi:hypothetical protein